MNFSKKNHEHRNNNKNVVSKKVRVTTAIMAMAFLSLIVMSCRDTKKEEVNDSMNSEMPEERNHDDSMMDNDDSMMDLDSIMNHDSSMLDYEARSWKLEVGSQRLEDGSWVF